MVRRLGPWQQRLRRHSMLLINGVYVASWMYTGQSALHPLLSDAARSRRLRFFGHICRTDPSQDHSRALFASNTGLSKHWRRQTWLRTIENNLRPLNLGLATAQRRAQNKTDWQTLVETATSLTSSGWWWWWWYCTPGKGVCGGANFFGSALLQPARSCLCLPERFFSFSYNPEQTL